MSFLCLGASGGSFSLIRLNVCSSGWISESCINLSLLLPTTPSSFLSLKSSWIHVFTMFFLLKCPPLPVWNTDHFMQQRTTLSPQLAILELFHPFLFLLPQRNAYFQCPSLVSTGFLKMPHCSLSSPSAKLKDPQASWMIVSDTLPDI